MGEEDNIWVVPGKLWDERKMLEGQAAGKGPQLVTLNCSGHIAADLQSYGDEPGTPQVRKANREAPGKYMKEIEGCSPRKVTHLRPQLNLHQCTNSKTWKLLCC